MVIQSQNNWLVGWNKRPNEQAQQDATERAARPLGAVEHAMIVLELRLLAQAHHAQRCSDRAFARRENCTDQQDTHPFPDRFAEGQFKVAQHVYNRIWQVAHGSSLPGSWV